MSTTRTKARVRARAGAAAGLTVAVLLLLTGCDLFAPQDTIDIHETSDGVSGTVGDVFVANAVLLTAPDGDGPAGLVASLVNQGTSSRDVSVHTTAGSESVALEPSGVVQLGVPEGETVEFDGLDAKPGSLTDVTFETGAETLTLQVPVLDGALPQYRDLVPTAPPLPTPTPTSTSK
ncbi:hypothetical protein [Leifsonia aquatica]|uniref:Uncharacterized protein n=2 Tax=Leifsonia aquatica TaxID=144185 RepID=U2TD33_LEIAQ|nr:hypothetical protein [Leifsonia aquatica]ERK72612.1 hypothetical protein N136_01032 [Leifsonia aquatica ATCC 14665]MBB2968809.1 hypothetical protein [Leifsonia aquatica]